MINREKEAALTHARLLEVLHYDPDTGEWRWLVDKAWNAPAGSVAGCLCRKWGYITITIDGYLYKSARLAVLYMTGNWPTRLADHEDRDRQNDKWENIREATHTQNTHNQTIRSNNKSGVTGISFIKQDKLRPWRAKSRFEGKRIQLHFATKEEAIEQRQKWVEQYHGAFGNLPKQPQPQTKEPKHVRLSKNETAQMRATCLESPPI